MKFLPNIYHNINSIARFRLVVCSISLWSLNANPILSFPFAFIVWFVINSSHIQTTSLLSCFIEGPTFLSNLFLFLWQELRNFGIWPLRGPSSLPQDHFIPSSSKLFARLHWPHPFGASLFQQFLERLTKILLPGSPNLLQFLNII